jgi:hypothetical protein
MMGMNNMMNEMDHNNMINPNNMINTKIIYDIKNIKKDIDDFKIKIKKIFFKNIVKILIRI